MKTIIFYIVLYIVLFLILAETKITFKPFTFKVTNWPVGIGWTLLLVGYTFVTYGHEIKTAKKFYKEGYTEGYNNGATDMREAVEKIIDKTFDEKK